MSNNVKKDIQILIVGMDYEQKIGDQAIFTTQWFKTLGETFQTVN
jgi:hypothetical protein